MLKVIPSTVTPSDPAMITPRWVLKLKPPAITSLVTVPMSTMPRPAIFTFLTPQTSRLPRTTAPGSRYTVSPLFG